MLRTKFFSDEWNQELFNHLYAFSKWGMVGPRSITLEGSWLRVAQLPRVSDLLQNGNLIMIYLLIPSQIHL